MDAHLVKPVPVATLGRLVDAVRDAHDALHATGDAGEATAPPHDGEASLLAVATLERLLRLGEDATFAPALVDAWAADSERRAMLIAVAGAAGDRAVLARVAHALEGSSANVGAAAVAACAAAIRRAAEPPVARATAAGPAVVTPDAIVAPDLEQAVAALPALVAATRAALRAAVARAVRGRTPWGGLPAVARR
jgi:HPt (histidine-containing phosphotransfer) domain-containing protein